MMPALVGLLLMLAALIVWTTTEATVLTLALVAAGVVCLIVTFRRGPSP